MNRQEPADIPSRGPGIADRTEHGAETPGGRQPADPALLRASVEKLKQEVGRGRKRTLTRHWPDILVLLAAVTVLLRSAYVLWTALGHEEPRASRHLAAFRLLQAEHMGKLDGKADSLRKKLAGRYLVRTVQKGSPVREADLWPAPLGATLPAGRHILPLQLAPGAAPDSLRAGTIADLLLSPAAPALGASPVFVQRVPVLAVSAAGEGMRVVVAVDRAQLDELAPRLGTSRVFVLTGGGAPAPTVARDTARPPADSTAAGG